MSTRAQITIDGQPVYLYKHGDGYPEGVLPLLEAFTQSFFKGRGYDPEYFMARLAHAFVNEFPDGFTGYGIDCEIHGDIEFLYVVSKDGKIRVLENGEARSYIKY